MPFRRAPIRLILMTDLPDLFPNFASHWIACEAGEIFARNAGSGPPALLLHGFGQTHAAFARLAPVLAKTHSVVVMDLRGYGWSCVPRSAGGEAYAKRRMASDAVAVMENLGHVRFSLIGHDRGARVGLRLALDHPGRIDRLALLDIVPFAEAQGEAALAQIGRAKLMSLAEPTPENLLLQDPLGFLADVLKDGVRSKSLDAFGARALAQYRAAFNDPLRIHAFCEDYRAGAGADHDALEQDRAAGKKLATPTLLLRSLASFPDRAAFLAAWRDFIDAPSEEALDSGRFLLDDAPQETARLLMDFLR